MEVNNDLVTKLAHLARLHYTDAQKELIQADLQRMIQFVEKLNEVNTDGVEPLLHMSEAVNVLRKDEVNGSITRLEALKNAPAHDETYFKVPKVIARND
jgi:aspartyl-tRNA(Asn)/glutamyl-tRNA(Gln) amidotransferase subunit C